MKKLDRVFIWSFFFFFYIGAVIGQENPPASEKTAGILANPGLITAIAVTVYELVVRVVPTVKKWSFLGKIIDFLKLASDQLNNEKAVKK